MLNPGVCSDHVSIADLLFRDRFSRHLFIDALGEMLSRHFLSQQANCISLIPFASGSPDTNTGISQTHNLLALGTWSEEAQEHQLTIVDLAVSHNGEVAAQPVMTRLASFQHPGRVAAVQACSLGGGEVVLAAASAEGGLTRLRMHVPLTPGSQPDAIQLQGDDIDGAAVQSWLDLHPAPTTSLDINADRREVVSTSLRGTVALSGLGEEEGGDTSSLYDCGGALSFTSSRWTSPNAFITGCNQGVLHVWDRRQPGRPSQQGAAPGEDLSCLAVHPAQPHLCASGTVRGGILVWDLRQVAKPAGAAIAVPGAVRDLHFDTGSDAPQLVFCTGEGSVGTVRDAGTGAVRLLYREPAASVEGLCCGSAGPVRQLFCVTDQEALVFMAGVL